MNFSKIILMLSLSAILVSAYWFDVPVNRPSEVTYVEEIFGFGDGGRFVSQGWWLRSGKGFREGSSDGTLCTSLPPGYPVFLGLLFFITENPDLIRLTQVALHLCSGLLFFLGCQKICPRLAFTGALIISASPWAASLCSVFLSEVLSTFLSVCLVVSLVQLLQSMKSERGLRLTGFLTGIFGSMTCLSAPGLAPVCAGVVFSCAVLLHRRKIAVAMVICGAALPMSFWQFHCIKAEGRPCLTLLNPPKTPRSVAEWICVWAKTEREARNAYGIFAWSTEPVDFGLVPSYAFRSEGEKQEFFLLANEAAKERKRGEDRPHEKQLMEKCAQITALRRTENPVWVYGVLPFFRAFSAILSVRPVDFRGLEDLTFLHRLHPRNFIDAVGEFGAVRASFRLGRGLLALWSLIIHFITAVLIFCVFGLFLPADWFCRSLLGFLVIFLFLFGLHAPEARRLIPAIPLFLSSYVVFRLNAMSTASHKCSVG